jgi:hypothetical protein
MQLRDFRIFDKAGRVAVVAGFRRMLSGQSEAGLCVIELRAVDNRDLRVRSKVFLMACNA